MTPTQSAAVEHLDAIAQAHGLRAYSDLQAFVTRCEQKFQTENHVAAIMAQADEYAGHPLHWGREHLEHVVRQTLAAVAS